MLRFWLVIAATFLVLLLAVKHVSHRASQAGPVDEGGAAASMPPPPSAMPMAQPAPRSYASGATNAALYKCVDTSGHQSFQSQPCPSDATQAWVRDATPEPEPTPEQRRRQARMQSSAPRSGAPQAYDPGYSTGSTPTPQDPGSSSACQAARAADAAYRRQPLRYVKHDGLRRLGDQINAACY